MADESEDTEQIEQTETEEKTFDYLSVVKMFLGIDTEDKDMELSVYIELTKRSILNYCNISELPSALDYTVCQITADTYRDITQSRITGDVAGNVSSISEDGRSVSFSSGTEFKTAVEDKISRTTELNRYKKLYRLE